ISIGGRSLHRRQILHKRKTAPKRLPRPSQARSDAVRPFQGSDPAAARLELGDERHTPGPGPRPFFPEPKAPDGYRNLRSAGRFKIRPSKKTPLMQLTSGTVG